MEKGEFRKKKDEYEKALSNYAFTLKNIKSNIFRLARNEAGDIIYLLNEGQIPNKFKLTTEVVGGKTVEEILGKERSRQALEYFERAFKGEIVQYEAAFDDVWFETILSPIEIEGEVVEVAGSSYDITERIAYQKEIERLNLELRYLSSTDKLTGIKNRYKLDEMLKYEILKSRRYNKDLSVVFFDIDHFKLINDKHGHTVGDTVLKDLANLCKKLLRETDIFGRWGGEEFLVICSETAIENAVQVAERIRSALDSKIFCEKLSVTASFGVCGLRPGMDFDHIIKTADNAMYKAKMNGRNRVETAAH